MNRNETLIAIRDILIDIRRRHVGYHEGVLVGLIHHINTILEAE